MSRTAEETGSLNCQGIYVIRNRVNGKEYVGSSISPETREKMYAKRRQARRASHGA